MNILVLGGQGFIGSHIVDKLFQDGHSVRVLTRSPVLGKPEIKYISGDFLEKDDVTEAARNSDAVVHCVSTTVPATSAKNPEYDVETNLLGTIQLLRIMRDLDIGNLIYFSSGGTVYGNPLVTPVPETAPLNPVSSYGAVKVATEKFIEIARLEFSLQSVILRPSNPFGERQGYTGVQGLVSTVLHNVLSGVPTRVFGDGSAVRDYIYVSDIANLVSKVVTSGRSGIYNAGFGKGLSVLQIIKIVEKVVGRPVELEFSRARGFDVKEIVLDSSLAHQHFGWSPMVSLETGIKRQYEWLKKEYGRANR